MISLPLLVISCNMTVPGVDSTVGIEIRGTTTNPVDISWTIHDEAGSANSVVLNHGEGAPYRISRAVGTNEYKAVSVTITDSGPTANNVLISGASNSAVASPDLTDKIVTLDQTILDAGGLFIVTEGDYLMDAGGSLMYIKENPSIDPVVLVSDINNVFVSGAWTLFSSNRSAVTVTVVRDGVEVFAENSWTTVGAVNITVGSLAW